MNISIQTYITAKRDLQNDHKLMKNAEATIRTLKARIPINKTLLTTRKHAAFEACGYALKGPEKEFLYDYRKKAPARCFQKYLTPVVEEIGETDAKNNDEFLQDFLKTHYKCTCSHQSQQKEKDSKHRCEKTGLPYHMTLTSMFKTESLLPFKDEDEVNEIHVIVAKDDYGKMVTLYLLPSIPPLTCSNLRYEHYYKNTDRIQPWKVPTFWDKLVEKHAQHMAARRIQKAWYKHKFL